MCTPKARFQKLTVPKLPKNYKLKRQDLQLVVEFLEKPFFLFKKKDQNEKLEI